MKKVLIVLLIWSPAVFLAFSIIQVLSLRWINPAYTPLMLIRAAQTPKDKEARIQYDWVSLDGISDEMIYAVIVAEDARFLRHNGFDFEELERMKRERETDRSQLRGCSTISQQTAKNCFTLCSRTWARKALEAYYTVLIERLWGKDRILEVYLNVAEMGPGIYGVEAAAQHYFHVAASDLTLADASSLACCLPNPLHRSPDWVNRYLPVKRAQIASSANKLLK